MRQVAPHTTDSAGFVSTIVPVRRTRRRRLAVTALGTAALLLASSSGTVSAQPNDTSTTPEQRAREVLRHEQAQQAAQLDLAIASLDQVMSALVTLDQHVQAEWSKAAENHRAIEDAERRVAQGETDQGENQRTIAGLTEELRRQAVRKYVSAGAEDSSLVLITTGDFDAAGQRKVLGDVAHGDTDTTIDKLRAARTRGDELTERVDAARSEAQSLREARVAMAAELKTAGDAQARVQTEWDKRQAVLQAEHDRLETEQAEQKRAAGTAPASVTPATASVPPALAPRKAPAPSAGGGRMIWPMAGKISRGMQGAHKGIDIWHTSGTPTYAALGGTVTTVGDTGDGYGNKVVVDHGNGLATMYAHHSRTVVRPGQSVGQGEQVGVQGATGNSSGEHLHFEVHVNGRAVDPAPYLPPR